MPCPADPLLRVLSRGFMHAPASFWPIVYPSPILLVGSGVQQIWIWHLTRPLLPIMGEE